MQSDPRCQMCRDYIHQPSDAFPDDRRWFDSSGDPTCWGNNGGPHVPALPPPPVPITSEAATAAMLRGALIDAILPAGGLPLVDELVRLSARLDGSAFDELRTRLATIYDVLAVEGMPEGAVICRHADDLRYYTLVNDDPADQAGFATYPEALARLGELPLSEDCPLWYVNLATGLKVELPPIQDIRADFDRDTSGGHAEFWMMAKGAVGVEALCSLCGEIFNPGGPDDMTHGQRASDEQPCGGLGVPVGWWH